MNSYNCFCSSQCNDERSLPLPYVDSLPPPFTMPPLPTTYDDETKGLIASVQRRQKDLSGFQIPRLRTCKGPLSIQQNFAAELREDIDTLGRQIEVANLE